MVIKCFLKVLIQKQICSLFCFVLLFEGLRCEGLSMNYIKRISFKKILKNTRGATLVEYATLLTLMGAIAVVSLLNFGGLTVSLFETSTQRIAFAQTAIEGSVRKTFNPMVFQVDTRNGTDKLIGFNLDSSSGLVDLEIDWGDGSNPDIVLSGGPVFYEYAQDGIYTVLVRGRFEKMTMTGLSPSVIEKFVALQGWGDSKPTDLSGAFEQTKNLVRLPNNLPDSVTTLKGALFASTYNSPEIGLWNVSNVKDMSLMFASNESFNQNLGLWNTGSVKDMSSMFRGATSFSRDISGWNTGSVSDFSSMFQNSNFNGNIGPWNMSLARTTSDMFRNNVSFNNSIVTWNTSSIEDFSGMFEGATGFNQDISTWTVSNGSDFSRMFKNATSFNAPVGSWSVSNSNDFSDMFNTASSFNQNLGNWNVSNALSFSRMFSLTNFNGDISGWSPSSGQDFSNMFLGNASFNQDVSMWNVSNGTNFSSMFEQAPAFNQDLSAWVPSSATLMSYMFSGASSFNSNLYNWNVSNVTDFDSMFKGASAFNGDVTSWDVSHISSPLRMSQMFNDASSFTRNLGCWNTQNVLTRPTLFSDGSGMSGEPRWGEVPSTCS